VMILNSILSFYSVIRAVEIKKQPTNRKEAPK